MKITDDIYIQFTSIQRQYCSSNQDVLQTPKPRAPEQAPVARNNLTGRIPEQDRTQMLMAGLVNEEEKGRKRRITGTCIIHANASVMVLLSCRCGSRNWGGQQGQRSVRSPEVSDTYTYKHVAFPSRNYSARFYMVLFGFYQRCEVLF